MRRSLDLILKLLMSLIDAFKVPVNKSYKLLIKGFYVLLYDTSAGHTVASFELLQEGHREVWGIGSAKNKWKKDSVKNYPVIPDGMERGHLVAHGNWNLNKKMAFETSLETNSFPQIAHFQAYQDVEQFARMISDLNDVLIITCPIENNSRVVKILICLKGNSALVLPFLFPNSDEELSKLSKIPVGENCMDKIEPLKQPPEEYIESSDTREKDYSELINLPGICYMSDNDEFILSNLPFEMKLDYEISYIKESPIGDDNWKERLITRIIKQWHPTLADHTN